MVISNKFIKRGYRNIKILVIILGATFSSRSSGFDSKWCSVQYIKDDIPFDSQGTVDCCLFGAQSLAR